MAAIEVSGNTRGTGVGRVRSKVSTRVDMTPMVDLGFLLITFFMLATTMSKPTSMSVFFPKKTDLVETEPIRASGVLTIFLGNHDEVYYLDGIAPDDQRAPSSLKTTRHGFELRNVIFAGQKRVAALPEERLGSRSLIVVIKPTAVSSYKNMVDVMDEMAITKTRSYALVDKLTEAETKLLGDRIQDSPIPTDQPLDKK
ncbi:Biopolymer transport protein ExbD/TolR [Dyadobacter soli]|uniref:Biopolymer transport protein ExbD/TolR n=1 Tax=Dyadobacter soli TaxID=659014 RepID=A0A1G7FTS7_9BACT|nr:biopolymer transporter ExbD [Dyadobacter soli]SDE79298.1 Biopolymer transport protein ExbD/TolR [Dyadobacter soli]